MIKRLLLLIAGAIVVIGLLSNYPTIIVLKIVGVLIFAVLGIALAIPGMGCAGMTPLTPIGLSCIAIALLLILNLLGVVVWNQEALTYCQVIIRDANNTIVSNYTTACP